MTIHWEPLGDGRVMLVNDKADNITLERADLLQMLPHTKPIKVELADVVALGKTLQDQCVANDLNVCLVLGKDDGELRRFWRLDEEVTPQLQAIFGAMAPDKCTSMELFLSLIHI